MDKIVFKSNVYMICFKFVEIAAIRLYYYQLHYVLMIFVPINVPQLLNQWYS